MDSVPSTNGCTTTTTTTTTTAAAAAVPSSHSSNHSNESPSPNKIYNLSILGINILHTIAPAMHNHIARHLLRLPGTWSFTPHECATLDSALAHLRHDPDFAGAVITMPYKKSIMPLLDELDELCVRIGACNGVYLVRGPNGERRLRGTNTDWRGIRGCLLGAEGKLGGKGGKGGLSGGGMGEGGSGKGRRPALIVGAGGASRAAVYALGVEMGCRRIYVVNRDEREVAELVADVERMVMVPSPSTEPQESEKGVGMGAGWKNGTVRHQNIEIVHVQTPDQATQLQTPYYVVGTVPDFEPKTAEEKKAREILEIFFAGGGDGNREQEGDEDEDGDGKGAEEGKGVFLDMCFKPRVTGQIRLARRYGWKTVEGTEIIGHQIEEQWRLWTGSVLTAAQQEEAWAVLRREAERSQAINF